MKIFLGFIYFSCHGSQLHNNNDSLDHHIETQVILIIFSLCSFFIGGLRVSLPLHVWSLHVVALYC